MAKSLQDFLDEQKSLTTTIKPELKAAVSVPAIEPVSDKTQDFLYKIQSGDTLGRIAKDFNVSVNDIVTFNKIEDPDKIYADQEIIIPGKQKLEANVTNEFIDSLKQDLKEQTIPTDYVIKTQRPDLSSWQFNIPLIGDKLRADAVKKYEEDLRVEQKQWIDQYLKDLKNTPKDKLAGITSYGSNVLDMFRSAAGTTIEKEMYPEIDTSDIDNIDAIKEELLIPYKAQYGVEDFKDLQDFTVKKQEDLNESLQELIDLGYMSKTKDGSYELTETANKQLQSDYNKFATEAYLSSDILKDTIINSLFDVSNITDVNTLKKNLSEINNKYGDIIAIDKLEPAFLNLNRLYMSSDDVSGIDKDIAKIDGVLDAIPTDTYNKILDVLEKNLAPEDMVNELNNSNIDLSLLETVLDNLDKKNNLLIKRNSIINESVDADKVTEEVNAALNSVEAILVDYAAKEDLEKIFKERTDLNESEIGLAIKGFLKAQDKLKKYTTENYDDAMNAEDASLLLNKFINLTKKESDLVNASNTLNSYLSADKAKSELQQARRLEGAQLKNLFNKEYQDVDFTENLSTILENGMEKLQKHIGPALKIIMWWQDDIVGRGFVPLAKTLSAMVSLSGQKLGQGVGTVIMNLRGKSKDEIKSYLKTTDEMIANNLSNWHGLPDGATNPGEIFNTYRYNDYAINNVNEDTTKTFKIDHDGSIEDMLPESQKYMKSKIQQMNPDIDIDNLKPGDMITMPLFDTMIRPLDGSIPEQYRYEFMAQHPTQYEVVNQAVEIYLDPLTWATCGFSAVVKILMGRVMPSSLKVAKTIASTGSFGTNVVSAADKAALKVSKPFKDIYTAYTTSTNPTITMARNSLQFTNEIMKGAFGSGMDTKFIDKYNLEGLNDAFQKWKGITTAKILPTPISDAVQTMLRESGLNLVWESKVKRKEALKELKNYYEDTTKEKHTKRQVSDKVFEILINPGSGLMEEWAILEKYGITKTGLIDRYKKILANPIIGFIANDNNLWKQIMETIDTTGNEYAAVRKSSGFIVNYTKQNKSTKELFQKLYESAGEKESRKAFLKANNEIDEMLKNGLVKKEDVDSARSLYSNYQEQTKEAVRLANSGANVISIPDNMYEVEFDIDKILSANDFEKLTTDGLVIRDKNTGLQISFPAGTSAFEIRDFLFNAYHNENVNNLKAVNAIREVIEYETIPTGTVGFKRTIDDTKKIVPGTEVYTTVYSTKWQTTMKGVNGEDVKIVVDGLNKPDVVKQLKKNKIVATSDIVPQYEVGQKSQHQVITKAKVERIKKNGKKETYIEKDWRAFDEKGNVYNVIDVKKGTSLQLFEAGNTAKNFTLWELLLESADEINLKIWKEGTKKSVELKELLSDYKKQKEKLSGHNTTQRDIFNVIEKDYNGIPEYLMMANNVENLYTHDKIQFKNQYNVLKNRYDKGVYDKLKGDFKGPYDTYVKLRDEKLKFLLMDKLVDRKHFNAITYAGQKISKGNLLLDSQRELLNGKDLTLSELNAIAKEYEDLFKRKIERDSAQLSGMKITEDSYLNKFGIAQSISDRLNDWLDIKKLYVKVEPKKVGRKPTYTKTKGEVKQKEVVGAGTVRTREHFAKSTRIDPMSKEGIKIVKEQFVKVKESISKETNKVRKKDIITLSKKQSIPGKDSKFFIDTVEKFDESTGIQFFSLGKAKNIPKKITDKYFIRLISELQENGIHTVIGVDIPKTLIDRVKKNNIKVVSVSPEQFKRLKNIGSNTNKLIASDIKLINDIRDIYLGEKKIEFWGLDNHGYEFKKSFTNNMLSDFEKRAIEIHNNRLEAHNKSIYGNERIEGQDVAFAKDLDDPLLTIEPDPVKSILKATEQSITYARENNIKAEIRLGKIDKKIVEFNEWKGTKEKPVKIYVVSKDTPFILDEFKSSVIQRAEQNGTFILPSEVNMNIGEISIKEFFDKNNIKYEHADAIALKDGEFLLSNGVPSGGGARDKFLLFKDAVEKNKQVFSYVLLKEKLIREIDSVILSMKKSSYTLPSKKMREDLKKGFVSTEEAMQRMYASNVRRDLKKVWTVTKTATINKFVEDQKNLWAISTNKNVSDIPRSVLDNIEKEARRIENSLKGLDKHVFQWEKKPGFFEQQMLKLRESVETKIKNNGDEKAIEDLILNNNISSSRYEIVNFLYKHFFRSAPKLGRALRGTWIAWILKYRPAWYVWNALDDISKYAMATRDVNGTLKLLLSQIEAFISYGGMMTKDVARIGLSLANIKEVSNAIKKITGADSTIYKRAQKLQKFASETKLFDRDMLSSNKGVIKYNRDKMIKMIGVDRSAKIINIIESINNARNNLYGNDYKIINDLIKDGGVIDDVVVSKDTMSNIIDSGMVETFTNAKESGKKLLYKGLGGDTWAERVGKSFEKFDTNLSLFGSVTEEARRSYAAYKLMQQNAVDLVKTNMMVKEFFFDYRDLTKAAQVFRMLFPFLTYSLKSAELYTKLVLKYYGYPAFRAAQAILEVWDTMVGDMESYNQEKFKIGNILFRANFSLLEYLRFVQDPATALKIWVENPQRAPLGLGFSPFGTEAVGALTGADYFDLTKTELKQLGWTNESIEKYIREQDQRKIEYKQETNPIEAMFNFIVDAAPALSVARQLIFSVDDAAIRNTDHILKYKTFREISKFLGVNLTEYTDYDEFTTKLNRLDPALRNDFIKKMKEESPKMYKQLQENTLLGITIDALKGDLTEEEARKAIQSKTYQQLFYDMEADNPGSGYAILDKNPEMKQALEEVWSQAEGLYSKTKAKTAQMYQQDKIIRAYIEKTIPSNLTTLENVNKYKILGADFEQPISKEQLKYDLLGKGLNKEQVNNLLNGIYKDTGIPLLTDADILRIKTESMEYEQLSKEDKARMDLEDKAYNQKLLAIQRIFPINYASLTSDEQSAIYNKYLGSMKKNLTDKEYLKWLNDRPEIEVKYRAYQEKYINEWGRLIEEGAKGKFYESFNKQPEWFKEFYFAAHPNARIYYPLQAAKEAKMLEIIAKEQQGFDMSNERKVFDEWYWSQTKAIDALTLDDPEKVRYLKAYKEFQSSVTPENYYTELLNQSDWFKEQYFTKNPEAKLYAETMAKLESLSEDPDAYSKLLKSFSLTSAGKKYAETHTIMDTHNKLEYRIMWNDIINSSSKEINYYDLFFKQPEWFKRYYFNRYPNRESYYSFRKELAGKEGALWSDYLWSTANTAAREAWFNDKPEDRDYYTNFIKPLSAFTAIKDWGNYYDFILDAKNKTYFERWSDGDVKKQQAAYLSRDYYKLPDNTWNDKKVKSIWLDKHPALRKYWDSDKTDEEKKLSADAKEYYDLKYNIENNGSGYDYYYQFKKNAADRAYLLKNNPALAKYLYKNSSELADEDGSVISKLKEYNKISSLEDKKKFINSNPEVSEYFLSSVPDGIKNVRKLQEEYFAITASNKTNLAKKKTKFLENNPELKVYWDVNALPDSAFTDKKTFDEWQKKWNKIERYFDKVSVSGISNSETIRSSLPSEYITPGNSSEGEWLKYKIYGAAMSKWVDLIGKNKTVAMYYFRQLPSWVREKYYSTHPENRWMNGVSLKSWIATGAGNYYNNNKAEAWALEQQKKYGKDMPVNIKKQVENILIRSGQWSDRSNWSSDKWDEYWAARTIKLSGLTSHDFETMPLLRAELAKVIKLYPILLVNNSNYVKYLKPVTWNREPLLTRI